MIRKFFAWAGVAVALAVIASPLTADELESGYFLPQAMFIDDDADRAVDDGYAGIQATFGYVLNEAWNIEVFGNSFNLDGFNRQDQIEFGVNGVVVLNREGRFSPFVLGGVSGLETEIGSVDESAIAASVGGGFMTRLADTNNKIRFDYRYRAALDGNNFSDHLFSIGMQFGFGDRAPKVVDTDGDGVSDGLDRCPNTPPGTAVDNFGCELDSDGDGVVDSLDKCPNTPRGTKVDASGCALPMTDSDGDGVSDDDDKCPNTPRGARVNASGCELDDDGDGVVNSADRCPNTKSGVAVDVNGCEIKEVINLPGVNFQTNSDQLAGGSTSVLDDAAATLRKNPQLVVEVAGHTDSDGSAAYNAGLSERRAKTVLNYLVRGGAAADKLSAKGYGEEQPIADNSSADGKARNRRVELRILSR